MKAVFATIIAAMTFISAHAYKFSYNFHDTSVSQAIVQINKDHPDVNINFIYNELNSYHTSVSIRTDDTYDALRRIIGLNPITIVKKRDAFYIEALQHGKYQYTGQAIGTDDEPVMAATIMLLTPKDSAVITYGISDEAGRFSIPCDRQGVIAKLTCVGYKPTLVTPNAFDMGIIHMDESSIQLQTINVEPDNAILHSDKSVYIPTKNQKNSAITGTDLIERMAIPQLRIGELKTTTGHEVKLYIDYVPANSAELAGMNIDDVKRVEYYDFPSDPRFQNDSHVINFIMQKYEYGGYVKGIYYDNFVTSRELAGYSKFQYKRMTYDIAAGVFDRNDKKGYEDIEDIYETYRLPQADGSFKEFKRNSIVQDANKRDGYYWASLKNTYQSDKITIANMMTIDYNSTPENLVKGTVTYCQEECQTTDFGSRKSEKIASAIYKGYWQYRLANTNSITFNPSYAYTDTRQNSKYEETCMGIYVNGARDYSQQTNGNIAFVHSFGIAGTLKAMCQGKFLQNKTTYTGTSSISDLSQTIRVGPGISYNYTNDKFYGYLGLGINWDKSSYGSLVEKSTAPWISLLLQYSPNTKNSASVDFSYSKSVPQAGYRSASVIQSNPFFSYTGNPALVPYNSYRIEGNYTFIPNTMYNISAFGHIWIANNRYVYDFEANAESVLRTVKQPLGSYAEWQYGIQGTTRQFDNKLQLSAEIFMNQAHNGTPYNWTKSKLGASFSSYFYLRTVYFGATYNTPTGYPDGCMNGEWITPRSSYTFQVGWSNRNWNLRFFTRNFLRYNTYATKATMNSTYYDTIRLRYSAAFAGFFQIMATYTFRYGKKVNEGNDAYKANGAESGILK